MKRPVRKVPKFKVGQVVAARAKLTNSSGNVVRAYRRDLLRIVDITPIGFVVVQRGNDAGTFATLPDELRPLTRRERGGK
jgi:hypothetical protein